MNIEEITEIQTRTTDPLPGLSAVFSQASGPSLTLIITLVILWVAFGVRLYRLEAQSIWWDEGHSIQMASAPITEIPTLPGMDVHPPGFFVTLHGWMAIAGQSKFALRYFSVGFSLLAVAWMLRFGRTLDRPTLGIWAALLMALSPFFVAYAQEMRMYAMVTCFALGSVYCLWQLLSSDAPKPHRAALLGYILFTTAALYTHYFTLFLLSFENLLWLLWLLWGSSPARLRTRLRLWLGSQLAILVLFLPQLQLALRQVTGYVNPNLTPPTWRHFLRHNWQAYTVGLTIDAAEVQPYLWGLLALLGLGVALHLRRRPFAMLLGWLLIPMALYFLVLQRQPSYEPRYLMPVTPSLLLLFAFTITTRPWTQLFGVGVAAIFLIGLDSYFHDPAYAKDEAEAISTFLAAETSPNDIVFVDVPHPFHYYAPQIPAPTEYLFVDVHTAADALNQRALGRERLFWVTWWGSDTDPRGVIPYLLQKQAGTVQGEAQFRGYRVIWYQLSERPFSLPIDLAPIDVNFDNRLRLDGLAYSQTLEAGGTAWATLHFSQLAPMTTNYRVSLRLRSPEGELLAQTDKDILNDRHFHTAAWPIDDPALNQTINVYLLPLNSPPFAARYTGSLTLEAVVYEAETLAAIAAYGVPTTNDDFVSAQIGQLEVR